MDTTVLVIIAVGVAILFDIAFVWYGRNRQISPIKSDQNRGFQKKIQRSYQHLSNVPKKIKNLPGRVLTKEKFSVGILTSCSIPQNAIDELNESAASQNATAKITKVSAVFVDEFWCVIVEYTNNATRDTYKLYKTLYRQNVTCTSHITRSTCRDLWLGSPGHRASALEKFLTKQQTANPLCSPDLLLSVIKWMGANQYVADMPGNAPPGILV